MLRNGISVTGVSSTILLIRSISRIVLLTPVSDAPKEAYHVLFYYGDSKAT